MAVVGWQRLLVGKPWFRGEGKYPVPAYSEFMPAPRVGIKSYGTEDAHFFDENDPWGWPVTEAEEFGVQDSNSVREKTRAHRSTRTHADPCASVFIRGLLFFQTPHFRSRRVPCAR